MILQVDWFRSLVEGLRPEVPVCVDDQLHAAFPSFFPWHVREDVLLAFIERDRVPLDVADAGNKLVLRHPVLDAVGDPQYLSAFLAFFGLVATVDVAPVAVFVFHLVCRVGGGLNPAR